MSSTTPAIPSPGAPLAPPETSQSPGLRGAEPPHNVETGSHTSTIVNDTNPACTPHEAAQGTEHKPLDSKPEDNGEDEFEVKIGLDDPEHPHNWSRLYRWYLTMIGGLLVMNATFASSAPTGVETHLIRYFTFSQEVAILTISLFVAGYCIGPLVWGPLSEVIGRRKVFIITFTFYTGFQVGCALSRNTASILIFRLLGGIFAAAPLSNSGALMSDIWDAGTRGEALAYFALAPFAGPTLGPLVSGFMAVSGVDWRWVFWLLTIFAGVCLLLIIFTLPETLLPLLVCHKAERLRKETGDNRYWAPFERRHIPFGQLVKLVLGRPFLVLAEEPMLIAITLYMSFVYGCVYLLFEAYPIVFTLGHRLSAGITGLMFLPIFLGGVAAVASYLLVFNPRYVRSQKKHAPAPVPPEKRLEIAMFGAPLLPIAFFWFGWTSYPNVSLWAPLIAGFPLGWSIVFIFLALFNYIIDAYLFVAASALSASTVVRSLFGAGFPLFAVQMYDTLNPRWASTLLGFIAILLAPIPFVLYKFGPFLRQKSKYAPTKPHQGKTMQSQPEEKKDASQNV